MADVKAVRLLRIEPNNGDRARQDLDHTLAHTAIRSGCVLALDSGARATRVSRVAIPLLTLDHARTLVTPLITGFIPGIATRPSMLSVTSSRDPSR